VTVLVSGAVPLFEQIIAKAINSHFFIAPCSQAQNIGHNWASLKHEYATGF